MLGVNISHEKGRERECESKHARAYVVEIIKCQPIRSVECLAGGFTTCTVSLRQSFSMTQSSRCCDATLTHTLWATQACTLTHKPFSPTASSYSLWHLTLFLSSPIFLPRAVEDKLLPSARVLVGEANLMCEVHKSGRGLCLLSPN